MAHILIIEDDPVYTALIARELEHSGYRVTAVTNGRQAMSHLARNRFDLIVTDILMPEMDGIEFIRRSPGASRAPILAISGYGSDRSINFLKVARILGADASLHKPFAVRELRAMVAALLDGTYVAPHDDEGDGVPTLTTKQPAVGHV